MTTWKLLAGGRIVQERPRYIAIGDCVLNHCSPSAQLSVYLRFERRAGALDLRSDGRREARAMNPEATEVGYRRTTRSQASLSPRRPCRVPSLHNSARTTMRRWWQRFSLDGGRSPG